MIVREVNAGNQLLAVVTDFGQYPDVHTTTVAMTYDARGNRTGEVTTRTTGGVTHVLNQVSYVFDGADLLIGSHDTGSNQNSAKDDVVVSF